MRISADGLKRSWFPFRRISYLSRSRFLFPRDPSASLLLPQVSTRALPSSLKSTPDLITVRKCPNVVGHSSSNSLRKSLMATNQPAGAHGAGTGHKASTVGNDAGNIIKQTAAKIHV